jgi:hypothetical protein
LFKGNFFSKRSSAALSEEQKETEAIKDYSDRKIKDIIQARIRNDDNFPAKEMYKLYYANRIRSILDIQSYKNRLRSIYFPLSAVLINMEMSNGNFIQFVARIKDSGFIFANGFYLIDENLKRYNQTARMYMFDYHEEMCFPVDKRIKVQDIKDELIKNDHVELDTAINPITLQKFMESTVIQKLLAGAELEDSLRFIKIMIILNVVISIGIILLTLKGSNII